MNVIGEQDALPSRAEQRIDANNDVDAVTHWLAEYRESPQTQRAYRREAERLMLWLYTEERTLNEVDRHCLSRFEGFLADPQPRARWVGPTKPRHHPEWRPMRGPLSPASRRQSLVILQGMYSWLVEAGWVAYNPFRLMRDKSRRLNNQTRQVERYFEQPLWAWFWRWLHRPLPNASPRAHFERARQQIIFAFAYLLAPRISEMAAAQMGDFYRREGRWWWQVVGKGDKLAHVPVPDDFFIYLTEWRKTLGLPPQPAYQEATPLLRALDSKRGISDNQLYRLICASFNAAAKTLEDEEGSLAYIAALQRATPHWLRHTAITHQAQAGVSLRYLAESARHARLETTSRYLHTEAHQWHDEQQRHRLTALYPLASSPDQE
ncbi:site-specific integrase [Halomonas vilamensis]|uniref:Site-specific integrase n=1 Tax=Vreelandella vilamensis TaxID=531309 RepID=A0ABU1H357_9GAMM|nr:site-specific integrase [Halomonas vilamensis]MDR5898281.1 site-specific integrase [Halomonas vilamensis]